MSALWGIPIGLAIAVLVFAIRESLEAMRDCRELDKEIARINGEIDEIRFRIGMLDRRKQDWSPREDERLWQQKPQETEDEG